MTAAPDEQPRPRVHLPVVITDLDYNNTVLLRGTLFLKLVKDSGVDGSQYG